MGEFALTVSFPEFIDMLNDMRFGNMDDESAREFAALSREVHYEDGIEPTEL